MAAGGFVMGAKNFEIIVKIISKNILWKNDIKTYWKK
jgi:hypothetical protein